MERIIRNSNSDLIANEPSSRIINSKLSNIVCMSSVDKFLTTMASFSKVNDFLHQGMKIIKNCEPRTMHEHEFQCIRYIEA
jgi:hypothetical protein